MAAGCDPDLIKAFGRGTIHQFSKRKLGGDRGFGDGTTKSFMIRRVWVFCLRFSLVKRSCAAFGVRDKGVRRAE